MTIANELEAAMQQNLQESDAKESNVLIVSAMEKLDRAAERLDRQGYRSSSEVVTRLLESLGEKCF